MSEHPAPDRVGLEEWVDWGFGPSREDAEAEWVGNPFFVQKASWKVDKQRSPWQPGQPRLSTDGQAVWDVDCSAWILRPTSPWQNRSFHRSSDGVWLQSWNAYGPLWIPYGKWQTYTMVCVHPQTGAISIYTGRTSGSDSPEENVRKRYLAHLYGHQMTPQNGWQPAVLDQFSDNQRLTAARERQLFLFYEKAGLKDERNKRTSDTQPELASNAFGAIPAEGIHTFLKGQELIAATRIGWTVFTKEDPEGKIYVSVFRCSGPAALNLLRIDRQFAKSGRSMATGWKPAVERYFGDKAEISRYTKLLMRDLRKQGKLYQDRWRLLYI
ncbi:MAG TPA: hypothetical protein VH593_16515 [Ktedonobacteraceae bacterium]